MMEIVEIIIRAILAFSLLVVIAHLLGKETIAQMTYHDFIGAIVIGAISGNLAFNLSIEMKHFIISLFTFSGIVYLATYLSLRNRTARTLFSGQPTVIIQDGKILEDNMKRLRFTFDSLNQALREKDVFDIDEVEYAVIENDGHLSILKKPPYRSVTKKDLNVFTRSHSLFPLELVMDGKVIERNLYENDLTPQWLETELRQRGVLEGDVAYCVRGTNGQLYIDLFQDRIQSPLDKE